MKIHLKELDEFGAEAKGEILQVAKGTEEDGYWSEETLLYFMAWYYALTSGASDPERMAKDNRSCPYCVQKTKAFTIQLIKALKDERND